jgi:hypothetical protein
MSQSAPAARASRQRLLRKAKGDRPDDPLKEETVIIEVLGGVAQVKECPAGVTVTIIDHDIGQGNAKAKGGAA